MPINVQFDMFDGKDELSLLRQEVKALRTYIEYMENEQRLHFHKIGKALLDLRRESKKEKKNERKN